jgi:hypothetical protein
MNYYYKKHGIEVTGKKVRGLRGAETLYHAD